jgi:hypothetical protein
MNLLAGCPWSASGCLLTSTNDCYGAVAVSRDQLHSPHCGRKGRILTSAHSRQECLYKKHEFYLQTQNSYLAFSCIWR